MLQKDLSVEEGLVMWGWRLETWGLLRKDRQQMWMFGSRWAEGEDHGIGGRQSQGRGLLSKWVDETLEVVTWGQVGEQGRAEVAGAEGV